MDLTSNKEQPHKLVPAELKCILKLIATGLLYLHKDKNIVHRDIKPPNILIYDRNGKHGDGIVKITDFNHSIELEKLKQCGYKGNYGTPWFKSPELLMELPYDYCVDVWALGCVFDYMLTGNFLFKFECPSRMDENRKRRIHLEVIFEKLGIPTNDVW